MPEQEATTKYYYGTGRRKRAIARVRLYEKGSGKFTVNTVDVDEYLKTDEQRQTAKEALKHTSQTDNFDVSVLVSGGGTSAQATAIRLGTARALTAFDEELRGTMKPKGFLKRDPRKKERKKPGLKKARRAPQFSKR